MLQQSLVKNPFTGIFPAMDDLQPYVTKSSLNIKAFCYLSHSIPKQTF